MIRTTLSLAAIPLIASYFWERFARQSLERELARKEQACATLGAEVLRLEDDLDAARDTAMKADAFIALSSTTVDSMMGHHRKAQATWAEECSKLLERAEKAEREAQECADISQQITEMAYEQRAALHKQVSSLETDLAAERSRNAEFVATRCAVVKESQERQERIETLETELSVSRAHAASLERELADANKHAWTLVGQCDTALSQRDQARATEAGVHVVLRARLEKALEALWEIVDVDSGTRPYADTCIQIWSIAHAAITSDVSLAKSSPPTRTAPLPEWHREALGKMLHAEEIRGGIMWVDWERMGGERRGMLMDAAETIWLNGYNAGCASQPIAAATSSIPTDLDDEKLVGKLVARATAKHAERHLGDSFHRAADSLRNQYNLQAAGEWAALRLVVKRNGYMMTLAQVPVGNEDPAPVRLGDTAEEEQAADDLASGMMGTTPTNAAIAAVRRASGATNPPVLARGFMRWHRTAASEIAGLLANLALMAKPPEQASRPTAEMAVELGELGCAGTEAA